jgi:hypothetical protein
MTRQPKAHVAAGSLPVAENRNASNELCDHFFAFAAGRRSTELRFERLIGIK